MLLTGYADVEAAARAVNEGHVFRFLTKPCKLAALKATVDAGLEQHRLVRAERALLEDTLNGSVRVLIDVLSLAAPAAFSRASSVRATVAHLVAPLGIQPAWPYELAALLSPIGSLALDGDLVKRARTGDPLTDEEQAQLDQHPQIGRRLLAHVPRLDLVSELIAQQNAPIETIPIPATTRPEQLSTGGAILRLATALDDALTRDQSPSEALAALRAAHPTVPEPVWNALATSPQSTARTVIRTVEIDKVTSRMAPDEDIRSLTGKLLVPAGRPLTRALVERLWLFHRGEGVKSPVRMRVPASR